MILIWNLSFGVLDLAFFDVMLKRISLIGTLIVQYFAKNLLLKG